MSVIGNVCDWAGALALTIGGVTLISNGHAFAISRAATGRVTSWIEEADGSTMWYRARLAYTDSGGVAREATLTNRVLVADRDRITIGAPVRVRYRTREPEYAAIDEGPLTTWGVPLAGFAIAVVLFMIGTRFG